MGSDREGPHLNPGAVSHDTEGVCGQWGFDIPGALLGEGGSGLPGVSCRESLTAVTRLSAAGAEVGQVRGVVSRVCGGVWSPTGLGPHPTNTFSLIGFEVVESVFLCDSGMKKWEQKPGHSSVLINRDTQQMLNVCQRRGHMGDSSRMGTWTLFLPDGGHDGDW